MNPYEIKLQQEQKKLSDIRQRCETADAEHAKLGRELQAVRTSAIEDGATAFAEARKPDAGIQKKLAALEAKHAESEIAKAARERAVQRQIEAVNEAREAVLLNRNAELMREISEPAAKVNRLIEELVPAAAKVHEIASRYNASYAAARYLAPDAAAVGLEASLAWMGILNKAIELSRCRARRGVAQKAA
jgi:hypothetical protein